MRHIHDSLICVFESSEKKQHALVPIQDVGNRDRYLTTGPEDLADLAKQ
jgi:hypothetical protein